MLPYISAINTSVKAAQETARTRKLLGQSLASDVTIHIPKDIDLSRIPEDTWREILVVSAVEVVQQETVEVRSRFQGTLSSPSWTLTNELRLPEGRNFGEVVVTAPRGLKCARCWRYVAEPQQERTAEQQEPLLCGRSTEAVTEFQKQM